uniref:Uncharacterized protein n=1 Tax=Steinernema glaseri TaxID=37863 RepID=A0A1I7Y5H2_9BILA
MEEVALEGLIAYEGARAPEGTGSSKKRVGGRVEQKVEPAGAEMKGTRGAWNKEWIVRTVTLFINSATELEVRKIEGASKDGEVDLEERNINKHKQIWIAEATFVVLCNIRAVTSA